MGLRLTFLCASPVEGTRGPAFGDGPLDGRAANEKAALPPYSQAFRAPSARCAQTAEALGVAATPEEALRDIDHGTWSGRTHADIRAEDPHGLSAWLTDPDAAPHGGESVGRLCRRTASWLEALPDGAGRVLAITEASVVRAALVHALSVPARVFPHLDVPHRSAVTLTRCDGLWHAGVGDPEVPRQRASADGTTSAGTTAYAARR
ncbi:histidine phosphatase family protein [Streptomyces sp. WMMC940]|uniref:histidine phosphatase family protein n=1 Tax=Streptomyces sp. WMMC940 TaxID=3015153 RepID=UPI0022B6C569|nr:histidine phosphatase family protein [Streptomyces sp. WMMC940]MCZ7456894.1 histidine phosphatase family protein [Streptomyces sp. WMMC940]